MARPVLDDDVGVKDIMDQHPQTVRVFLRLGLRCIGCPIAPFHTLADAAREHGCDLEELSAAVAAAIALEQARR